MEIVNHNENCFNDLAKRMLMLSYLGVAITHADGHRWIEYVDDEHAPDSGYTSFDKLVNEYQINFSHKVYGSFFDALNYIDHILELCDRPSLLNMFHVHYCKEVSPKNFRLDEDSDDWQLGIFGENRYGSEEYFKAIATRKEV